MTDRYRCRFETIQQRIAPTRQMESAPIAFVRSRVRHASSQIPPTPPSVLRQVFVGYEARLKVTEPAHRKRETRYIPRTTHHTLNVFEPKRRAVRTVFKTVESL